MSSHDALAAAEPPHADGMRDLYESMEAQHLAPLWDLYQNIVTREPVAVEPSYLWRYEELLPTIERSAEAVRGELADHRVLLLKNPHFNGRILSNTNLIAGIQCVMPGERTVEHRHSASACRLILDGSGGSTFVEGKRCRMYTGDFIITPNWTWHGHENDSSDRAIWLDMLDAPLARYLDANFGATGPADAYPKNVSTLPDAAFSGGMTPESAEMEVLPYSPRFRWSYDEISQVLDKLPRESDGTRTLRYTNPQTGGAVMPTMDARLIELERGIETGSSRTTANALCIAIEGEGRSVVGDVAHKWAQHDIFTIPHWSWVSHAAATEGARLLIVSDREALRRLGLLREERG